MEPPVVSGIAATQKSFSEYQSRAFPQRSPAFFALELAGEVGELANEEKKLWRDSKREVDPGRLSEEAADVFIALVNYCNERNLDLEAAVTLKLREIEERRSQGRMGPVA